MKTIYEWLCLVLLLCFLCPSILIGQGYLDRKGIVRSEIMSLIQARYGKDFQYVGYSMLDSLIRYSWTEKDYRTQDPFNTLKGCVLFSMYTGHRSEPDSFIVGMVKDGRIIWDNAPGTRADLGGHLLYAQDINDDGQVDLIVHEVDLWTLKIGKAPSLYFLYVLSWDGIAGRFINAFSDNGKSALLSDGGCELLADRKGSKVFEIETRLPSVYSVPENFKTSVYPLIRYTWNGKLYGLWPQTVQKNKPPMKK